MKMSKLRISHHPQVPCKAFHVEVSDLDEAIKVRSILVNYDLFQFENRIKPDYANMTTLEEYDEEEGDWLQWYNEDGLDFDEYLRELHQEGEE